MTPQRTAERKTTGESRVVYYAMGGGHGHVARGTAVLCALGEGALICPGRMQSWPQHFGVATLVPPQETPDAVRSWLAKLPVPELLLVDVFPQGVAGELLPLLGRSRAWLIARRAPVRLFLETDARALVESRYERILWCETPDARLRSLAVAQADVEAILIADRKDTRLSLRQALNVADADALVVAIGTGPAQRQFNLCRLLGRICARLGATLRFFSLELPAQGPVCRRLPAAPYLRAADLVVCAAGYHAYHEALAAGALAIFLPQRRRYDDQFLRAAGQVQAQSPGELEARMREMLQRSAPPGMAKPWPRGAMQVAEMTRALLE